MITFERITAQHLKSSTGFEILPGNRFSIIYREEHLEMVVDLEFGRTEAGAPCVTVWPGAFARWTENSPVLSNEEQQHIENNFQTAMQFDGFEYFAWDPQTEKYLDSAVYHVKLTATWS